MPLLFSYGTLRQEEVQLATFGRRLHGTPDELVGFEPTLATVTNPEFVLATGTASHANARFTGSPSSRVAGIAFAVTDEEL
ncbi:MAG: gamma-glutamylcyclotransferase, partial [Armatimonadetes bacterium]|nr:gamma-glutamylcyclotransferase [Armatimonadota bacterium]